jgi:translation elongation factor EF-Tu-like GTPase
VRSMSLPRDVEVEFEMLRTTQGRSPRPLLSGDRPQFYYQHGDWDCQVTLLEAERAAPGDVVRAELTFLSPHEHERRLHVGTPFLLREGYHVRAYGAVTRILDLSHSASRARAGDPFYPQRDPIP